MAKRSKNKASGVIWLVALLCIVCLLYEPLARRMGVDTEKEGITALLGKLSERAVQRADSLLVDTLAVQSAQPAVGKKQTEATKVPATAPSASRKAPAAKGSSASKMPTGEALLRPAPMKKGTPERILRRRGYITSYNSYTKLPNWVAWELNREKLVERESRTDKFLPDPDLSPAEAVTTDDYKRSGWDRGHMCPAGDNRWHWRAMQESFYMTNICPQHHNLNRATGRSWKRPAAPGRSARRASTSSAVPCSTTRSTAPSAATTSSPCPKPSSRWCFAWASRAPRPSASFSRMPPETIRWTSMSTP